jgi:endonuclease/exonuclease/phosphatase family metal-dependent hydrolase
MAGRKSGSETEGSVRRLVWSLAALVVAAAASAAAAGTPVAVDGQFAEWRNEPPACSDASGDGGAVDFGRVWVRSDSERVTIRFEVGSEISLQGSNSITLLVDGDGDASTGRPAEGIGAELTWVFGERSGVLSEGGRDATVEQSDVGLRQAPTVTSTEFEVSFHRRTIDGVSLIPGPKASIVLVDRSGPRGDRLPDRGAVTIALSDAPPPPPPAVSLERRNPDDVRVLTYNVLFDGLFKRPGPFVRVLRAVDPDVICFQEIWTHTARQAADQVSLALPGSEWFGAHTSEGHVVSRFPLIESSAIDEAGNYWALIDLPDDRYATDLSVVSAHPPCCDNEVGRQEELDGIAAWVRDLVAPGGRVPEGTPIVVAGDMNLVGGARQVRTLVAGEIVDEATYGSSGPLDWDGTPLADAEPLHAGGYDTFTWRDARSSFAPGKLDYIVYSDSVLELENAFVLSTEDLAPEVLERYGLRPGDTLVASDHLPVVADFTPSASRSQTEAAE